MFDGQLPNADFITMSTVALAIVSDRLSRQALDAP